MEKIEFLDNFDPTPRITKAGRFVGRLFHMLPEVPLAPSQYPKHPERIVADPQLQLEYPGKRPDAGL